jgi:hypothetical protein
MIGTKQVLIRSLVSYFYRGGDCESGEAEFQPRSAGDWVLCDAGEGGSGTIVIAGTAGGESVEDTISDFDSEGKAVSSYRFTAISSIDVALIGSTEITLYPASETGDIIDYTTYSESYVRINWKYTSSTSANKVVVNVGGKQIEAEIEVRYNKNQNINLDDLLYIDGSWFRVDQIHQESRATKLAYLSNTGSIS